MTRATPREPGGTGGSSNNDAANHRLELAARHGPSVDESLATTRLSESPREDDYPLWRVRCRVSFESISIH